MGRPKLHANPSERTKAWKLAHPERTRELNRESVRRWRERNPEEPGAAPLRRDPALHRPLRMSGSSRSNRRGLAVGRGSEGIVIEDREDRDVDEATARPWHQSEPQAIDYWSNGSEVPVLGGNELGCVMPSPADAALIVEAVNNYDRLRRIEAAMEAVQTKVEATAATAKVYARLARDSRPVGEGLDDLRDAVEIMDQKITPLTTRDEDGTVATYAVGDSTWHRVLAIARGSTSDKARIAINGHRADRSARATELLDAVEEALGERALPLTVQTRLKAAYNAVIAEANR